MLTYGLVFALGMFAHWYAGDKINSTFISAKAWVDAWKAKP